MVRRRDRSIAAALAIAATVLLIVARADGGAAGPSSRATAARTDTGSISPPDRPTAADSPWSADPLPPGWHEIDRPLTDVTLPVQVFAAATYPLVLHHPPGRCGPPPAILAEMPPGGVLLQVIEYPPWDESGRPIRVPRLPRRPHRFAWDDATWGPFECAGPSFKFDYRQSGHALQAQVWMHRTTADPTLRAGALRILDNLHMASIAGR
jgi:hypothetical protein